MKGKVLKTVGIAVASVSIIALILTAVNMDKDTGFIDAGKKWINDIAEGVTGRPAFIEEYADDADEINEEYESADASVDMDETVKTVQKESVEVNETIDEEAAAYEEAKAMVYGEKSGISMISEDVSNLGATNRIETETLKEIQNESETHSHKKVIKSDDDLPRTYDEFAMLDTDEMIAIAEYLGDEYVAWLDDLEAHQDDGYTIITAGDSVEVLD